MKSIYEKLEELRATIEFSDDDGINSLYDDPYFEDVIELCKEIVEYIK